MGKNNKVHIVGAGLSGMIAAINLAREGFQVIVLDKAKRIGDVSPLHPSYHGTPMDFDLINDYVGIDISPCFIRAENVEIYQSPKKYTLTSHELYLVERGPRESAMDIFLYNMAKEAGVEFQFGQVVKDPKELPDSTIIATGLFKEMGEAFKRPLMRLPCYTARREEPDPNRNMTNRIWFGPYTNAYAYGTIMNGIDYLLLFTDKGELTSQDLNRFEEDIEASDGTKADNWEYFEVYVPTDAPGAPELFADGKILTGTLSGMMEPGLYFGIHGAIISGKIAALAVTDPERALKDFKHYNKLFKRCWYLHRYLNNPVRLHFFKFFFSNPGVSAPFAKFIDNGIPGVDHFFENFKTEYAGSY